MTKIQYYKTNVQMPLLQLSVVTPLVSTGDSHILISPGSNLTEEQYSTMPAVTDIVAPNGFHSAGVSKAIQNFPKAKVWGVQGLGKIKPEILWNDIDQSHWPFQKELPFLSVKGMPKVNEVIFFEPTSKTLIVTDLLFNLVNPQGLAAFIFFNLFGTYKKLAVSRLFALGIKNRDEFKSSMNQMMEWDFQNLVMSHGEPVILNAKEKVKAALQDRGFY